MEQRGFFRDTLELEEGPRQRAEGKAKSQAEIILEFFRQNPRRSYTPWEVWRYTGLSAPVTSIRARMTVLADRNLLIKTPEKRPGQYGMDNYCWRLATPEDRDPSTRTN